MHAPLKSGKFREFAVGFLLLSIVLDYSPYHGLCFCGGICVDRTSLCV